MPQCNWCHQGLSLEQLETHTCWPKAANDKRLAAAGAVPAAPAPVKLSAFTVYAQAELRDENGALVAVVEPRGEGVALRLAACWNACEGVPTGWLQNWAKPEFRDIFGPIAPLHTALRNWMERFTERSQRAADAVAERDALLAALRAIKAEAGNPERVYQLATAALAKHQPQAGTGPAAT